MTVISTTSHIIRPDLYRNFIWLLDIMSMQQPLVWFLKVLNVTQLILLLIEFHINIFQMIVFNVTTTDNAKMQFLPDIPRSANIISGFDTECFVRKQLPKFNVM